MPPMSVDRWRSSEHVPAVLHGRDQIGARDGPQPVCAAGEVASGEIVPGREAHLREARVFGEPAISSGEKTLRHG